MKSTGTGGGGGVKIGSAAGELSGDGLGAGRGVTSAAEVPTGDGVASGRGGGVGETAGSLEAGAGVAVAVGSGVGVGSINGRALARVPSTDSDAKNSAGANRSPLMGAILAQARSRRAAERQPRYNPRAMAELRTVLVVDDSATVARQLTKIFEESGRYKVLGHAADGLQALKMVREMNPDFVCLDVVMPNLDGVAALRTIRQFNREARVIIISSLGGVEEMMKEFLGAGAKCVLSKPFDAAKVLAALDAL